MKITPTTCRSRSRSTSEGSRSWRPALIVYGRTRSVPTSLSPYKILKEQAEVLGSQTKGILHGEVEQRTAGMERIALNFDIVVPRLDGSRYRILTIGHGKDSSYPAVLDAEAIRNAESKSESFLSGLFSRTSPRFKLPDGLEDLIQPTSWAELQETAQLGKRVANDRELIEELARVLSSPSVVSLAQSLIARVNDASTNEFGPGPPAEADDPDPAGESSGEANAPS